MLDLEEALILKEFGFPQKKPAPGDIYTLNEEIWIIGGCLNSNLLIIPQKVIDEGTWLPTHTDLWDWLQQNKLTFTVSSIDAMVQTTHIGHMFLGSQKIMVESPSLDNCLFHFVCSVLEIEKGDIIH